MKTRSGNQNDGSNDRISLFAPLRFPVYNHRKVDIMNNRHAKKVCIKGWKTSLSHPVKITFNLLLIVFGLALALSAPAQDQVPPPMPAAATYTPAQLDQLTGPVALYPDPLLSVLLPAATFPTQIVMADRYLSEGGDPNAIDQQPWDPSVQALAHYPDVLKWMDDNLTWATQLGQAFLNQQQDVMASVQRLRLMAYNLGNLQSTPQQQVVNDNGNIEILPVDANDVYVPDYEPAQVYYDAPVGAPYITFAIFYPIGPWLCCDFDWWHHNVIYWDHDHPRPYNWWHQTPVQRQAFLASGHVTVWNSNNHPNYGGYQGGDRGWNNRPAPAWNGGNVREPVRGGNEAPHAWNVPTVDRPAPAPDQHYGSDNRGVNDAFIGSQSAQDARSYSERGNESEGRPAPSFGGGGESSHSSESGGGASSGGFHGGGAPSFGGGGGGGSAPSFGGGGGGGGGGGHR
jgi:hypothetical protein